MRNFSIAQGVSNSKSAKLQKIYASSNWVVFIEPRVDLNYFTDQNTDEEDNIIIIHYPDKNINSSGYSSITVTQKSQQYSEVIKSFLEEHIDINSSTVNTARIIKQYNTFSGEWLMSYINNKLIDEKISLVSSTLLCRQVFTERYQDYTWIPLALDEILRVTGSIGGSLKDVLFSKKALAARQIIDAPDKTSDDLLMAGIKIKDDKVFVKYIPVEVKHGVVDSNVKKKAHEQAINTWKLLKQSFQDEEDLYKRRIDKKIYRNYMIQHVIANIEKMLSYKTTNTPDQLNLINSTSYRIDLLNDHYTLEFEDNDSVYAVYYVKGSDSFKCSKNGDGVIELMRQPVPRRTVNNGHQ